MSTAIRIENLSKRYMLNHSDKPQGYTALRDVLAEGAKSLAKGILSPATLAQRPKKEEFWALKDINLEIAQGDKIALIGHNGAGKSTLLKTLSRITEPTTGKIELYGRVASLLEVGTGFHPELTGRENIYLNGSILGMTHTEIRRKFDEIVDFAGVEKFLDTPVKRYSSGMRMRLGFAVAAHLESEILIIDEVLAVGDAAFQKKCLGKMDEVSKAEGRTIIFVSHNIGAVQQLCEKGIVLQYGKVAFSGHVNDAIEEYKKLSSIEEKSIQELNAVDTTSSLRVHKIWMENALNMASSSFSYREPFEVCCEIEALNDMEDISFHIGVNGQQGRIFTSDSHEFGFCTSFKKGHTYTVRATYKNFSLMPGEYQISKFYIRNTYRKDIIALNFVHSFNITSNPYSIYNPPFVNSGMIAGQSEWKIDS